MVKFTRKVSQMLQVDYELNYPHMKHFLPLSHMMISDPFPIQDFPVMELLLFQLELWLCDRIQNFKIFQNGLLCVKVV